MIEQEMNSGTDHEVETSAPSTPEPTLESKLLEAEQPKSELFDLDSAEKFRFKGKEWTREELDRSLMLQPDYTRKTQAIAEERKYYDNLQADLDQVKQNPALLAQFKSIYPEKFHKFLGYVSSSDPQAPATSGASGSVSSSLPPEILDRLTFMESKFSELHEKEVEAHTAEIDAQFKKLEPKYPLADEQSVLVRAEQLLRQKRVDGEKKPRILEKEWESLWKSEHERIQKRADQVYSKRIQEQKNANLKGRDVASGGGTPGQAPKMPRTIKEATLLAQQEMENQ